LRYLTDYVNELPLNALQRLLNTNDVICQLVYLLQHKPWCYRTEKGDEMRFEDGQWKRLQKEETLLLGRVEAQVWIALYNLLVDPECRKKYEYNQYRQETVGKLRDYLTPTLVDQLPVLQHVQRAIEEIAILTAPMDASTAKVAAMIEEVPEMADEIMSLKDWNRMAQQQLESVFHSTHRKSFLQSLSDLYNLDTLEALLPDDPKCANCGVTAVQRCSRCKNEWYCGRACQVKNWKLHKSICDLHAEVAARVQSAQIQEI
jgi:hypothetical protein